MGIWKKLYRPFPAIVTIFVFVFIGILSLIRLNLHFLDPVNYGVKDYDLTDIVYSQFRNRQVAIDERIVIVNIGHPDRATIAAMLARIAAAQPKAIGMDVFFEDRQSPAVDSALQAALKGADNIVISSKLQHFREDQQYFESGSGIDTFFSHYARTGYANFPSSDARTVRFFSPQEATQSGTETSFAVAVAELYDAPAVERLRRRQKPLERIHYTSTEDNFIQFEPSHILDMALDLRPILAGKIVLIGYNDADGEACPLKDKFYTPLNERYAGRSEPDMYGIAIHANIIQMILDRQYIFTIPSWLSFLLALVFCYANVMLLEWIHQRFPRWYHPAVRVWQVVAFALLFFLLSFLFHQFRIKWDFSIGLLALALYFDVVLSYESFLNSSRPWIDRLPKMLKNKPEE